MGVHHIAIAAKDIEACHRFYTAAMGFRLVRAEANKTEGGGFAKHLFYDTGGGGLMALWDLHDEQIGTDWNPAIAGGLGLPTWTNHLAFDAADLDDLDAREERLLAAGHDVLRIDHDWCVSIYTNDPNGILVEFCTSVREFTDEDAAEAERVLRDPTPPLKGQPPMELFRAADHTAKA